MSDGQEDFWSNVPEEDWQPGRVKIVEALRRLGKPLSSLQLVNVLDGDVSMKEAEDHLKELQADGLVAPVEGATSEEQPRDDDYDVPYRLDDEDRDSDAEE